jgi:hypothetical protein
MIDIGTLDTIIAMVVVLLVLSLLVQSIQSLLKKLLKSKSTVVMSSLLDLFHYVDTQKLIGQQPEKFVEFVKSEFQKLGRQTARGRLMMDSIAKDDLLKVVERIAKNQPDIDLKQFNPATLQAEVSKWFDAVMQSFDERYTRHMKTVSVFISVVVVIVLNANIFTIYRNIALNDALRTAIVSMGPQVQKQAGVNNAAGNAPNEAAPSKTGDQTKSEIKQNADQLQQFINDYRGLGFTPLRPQQIRNFIKGEGDWQHSSGGERFAHALKVLLGWGIMVLLLSVGAPFWEDALESLFGVKNLLRKRSDTSNVEDRGGQQKP